MKALFVCYLFVKCQKAATEQLDSRNILQTAGRVRSGHKQKLNIGTEVNIIAHFYVVHTEKWKATCLLPNKLFSFLSNQVNKEYQSLPNTMQYYVSSFRDVRHSFSGHACDYSALQLCCRIESPRSYHQHETLYLISFLFLLTQGRMTAITLTLCMYNKHTHTQKHIYCDYVCICV